MNNLDSWRAFLKHVKTHKVVLAGRLCPPGPPIRATGGLGSPRPNLLFSKMTLLFHFITKTLFSKVSVMKDARRPGGQL